MNEWIEGSDAKAGTVSVWTPWGEQKVLRSDARGAASRRAGDRALRDDATGVRAFDGVSAAN